MPGAPPTSQLRQIDPHSAVEVVDYLTSLEATPDSVLWRLFANRYVHDNALLTHQALSCEHQPVLHQILEQHDSTLSLAKITARALQLLAPNLGSASSLQQLDSLSLDTLSCLVACLQSACGDAWAVLVPDDEAGAARWRARLAAKLLPKDTHNRGVLLPGLAEGLSALAAALQLRPSSHHTVMLAHLSSTLLDAWTHLVRLKDNAAEVCVLDLAVQPAAACALQLLRMETHPASKPGALQLLRIETHPARNAGQGTAASAAAAAAAPSSSTQHSRPGGCGDSPVPQHLAQDSEPHSIYFSLALQAAEMLAMSILAAEATAHMAALMLGVSASAVDPSPAVPFLGSTELLQLQLVYLGATVKMLHAQQRSQSPVAAWAASIFGGSGSSGSNGGSVSLDHVPAWHDVLLRDVLGVSLPAQLDASKFTAFSGGDIKKATASAMTANNVIFEHQQKLNQQQRQQQAPAPSRARSAAAAAAEAAEPWPAVLSAAEAAGFIRVLLEAMCLQPERAFIVATWEPMELVWQMWAAHEQHQKQQGDRTPEAAAAAAAQFTELCQGVLLLLSPAVLWGFKKPAAASTGIYGRAPAVPGLAEFEFEPELARRLAFMLPLMLSTGPDGVDHLLPALQQQPLLVTTALQAMLRGTATNFSDDAGAHLQLMAYQISTLPSAAQEQLSAALGPAAGGASTAGSSHQRRLARELLGLLTTCLKVAAAVRIGTSTGSSSWDAIRTAVNAGTAGMGVVNSGFSSGGISSGPVNGPAVVLVARCPACVERACCETAQPA